MDFLDVHQTRYLLQWWSPTKLRFFSRIWSDVSRAKKTLPICANPLSMIAALERTRVETQHPLTGEGCYGNRKRKPLSATKRPGEALSFAVPRRDTGPARPGGQTRETRKLQQVLARVRLAQVCRVAPSNRFRLEADVSRDVVVLARMVGSPWLFSALGRCLGAACLFR